MYDFELFELLPVLDKVDSAKAEALRRDHANLAALNNKYPNGVSSLNPDSAGTNMMLSMGDPQGATPGGPIPLSCSSGNIRDHCRFGRQRR